MKTKSVPVTTSASYNFSIIQVAILIVMVALVVIPLFSSSSASSLESNSRPSNSLSGVRGTIVGVNERKQVLNLLTASDSSLTLGPRSGFSTFLQPLAQDPVPEVATFAADCTTPKDFFNLGETVCAITDGVDLSDGTYNVNWVSPTPTTTNGGTITTNPQSFLFSLPTSSTEAGLWKVNIGRTGHSTLPDDPAIIGNPPTFTVEEGGAMATFAADCMTPKTSFVLGEVVCARATQLVGFRFAWQNAAGYIEDTTDITTDPQFDTFTLPTTQTSVIDGVTVDNRGQWRANAITSRNSVKRSAFFTVTDPQNPVVDLSIDKSLLGDNPQQGGQVQYLVRLINNGPDDAANVHFVDDTFTGATFDSVTETSALGFVCTGSESADCTITTLAAGSQATFLLNFTAGSAGATLQNTAEVSSGTTEQNPGDNQFTTAAVVIGSGTPPPACTLNCPNNINANADTEENGQRGAHVNYDAPVVSDEATCGTVTTTPASGSFFPVGTTTVTASSSEGNGSCSFTITVTETGSDPPNISCPANKEVDAHGDCSVVVNDVGTATATGGENVTIFATRSDGKPMYNCDSNGQNCVRQNPDYPFGGGTTTITWTATSHNAAGEETGNSSCTQTITVNNAAEDTTAPAITCPANITRSNDSGQCSAVINVGTATAMDNCDSNPEIVGTRSDNQPLDAPYPKGTTTITWTATDASGNSSSCSQTVTVNDTEPPAITCPANITTSTEPGTCSAHVAPGTATATDNCGSTTVTGTRSDGRPLTDTYPRGTTTITWRATDSSGNYSECTQTVTVADDEAPVITFNGVTPSMWPPNHNYRNFTTAQFISSVSDNCDSLSVNDVTITKVTSDEAEESLLLGDGTTFNDMVIAADCKSVQLRAERVNSGNGRVYTIHFKLVDSSGNVTTGTAKVYSPKNQGETPGDDAVQYTVTSTCP